MRHTSAETEKRTQTEWQRNRTDFYHHGKIICRDTFIFLHAISKDKLTALLKHYRSHGAISAKVHKLSKKLPKNALTFDKTKHVVTFIVNYAETHAMSLPGRVPGYARDNLKLLPSSCSRKVMYDGYVGACKLAGNRVCSLVLFRRLWRQLVPFIAPCVRKQMCVGFTKRM